MMSPSRNQLWFLVVRLVAIASGFRLTCVDVNAVVAILRGRYRHCCCLWFVRAYTTSRQCHRRIMGTGGSH